MSTDGPSLEALFEQLFDEPAGVRQAYYEDHCVAPALAQLVEELLAAHAEADFEIAPAPTLSELDASGPGDPVPATDLGHVLDGRYRLDVVLGGGSFGTVYRAQDLLVGEDVAVKVPSVAPLSHAALEREAACLRRLEHGVARLRDQGVFRMDSSHGQGERHYLVYDLIDGQPFPGAAQPRVAFRSLVASLAAVHARGVVHRDLKPANVLVTSDGTAFLVDFGIAHGPAFAAEGASRDLSVGTEAFAAPEQLEGEMGDARSDVYSAALMGLHALTGVSPLELRGARRDPVPLQSEDLELCLGLHRVLQQERGRRARNACEVAVEWFTSTSGGARTPWTESVGPGLRELLERALAGSRSGSYPHGGTAVNLAEALEAVFVGLEPLHHLRSGAARELARRLGGYRATVDEAARLLLEWIERGIAFWRDGAVEVHAAGLEGLRSEAFEGSVEEPEQVAAVRGPAELNGGQEWVSEVLTEALQMERRGWDARATSLLVSALARVRTWPLGVASAERRILPLLVRLAVQDGTALPLDRAAFEVARSRLRGQPRWNLDYAIEVARASANGDEERATRDLRTDGLIPEDGPHLVGLPDRDDVEWERLEAGLLSLQLRGSLVLPVERRSEVRRAVGRRVRAYMRARSRVARGDDEGALTEKPEHGPLFQRRFQWLALRAYRHGRFQLASALHRRAARASESAHDRASSLLNAASAAMEAWDFLAAKADAAAALQLIESAPFPVLEARAVWTLRTLQFRGGALPPVDMELDAAFEALGAVRLQALHALTEAAIARVAGDRTRCLERAAFSLQCWQQLGQPEPAALMRALMIDQGDDLNPSDDDVFDGLARGTDAGVALQVLALAPRARVVCADREPGWTSGFQPVPAGYRLDVLGVDEIETALGIAGLRKG